MRFKKGSKVEVLSKKEVPSGSWQCAEIICGNGQNYTVRYDISGGTTVVERVSKKDIRPCPPPVEVSEDWVPGDLVEVFHNFAWKLATISEVLGKKHVLVRLLGSSWECKVSKFDIRVRRSWQDDQWVVIGKSSKNYDNGKRDDLESEENHELNFKVQKTNTRMNSRLNGQRLPAAKKLNVPGSHFSSKTLKRAYPYGSSKVGFARAGMAKKLRVIEDDGTCRGAIASNPPSLAQQFDVALSRDIPCFRTSRFPEADLRRRNQSELVRCSFAANLETDDAVSVASSVGSCSVNSSNSHTLARHVSAGPTEHLDSGDAESLCQSRGEEEFCVPLAKEDLAAEIHRLELHAYRCTMEALHALGPLSWEQEEMMTNLRLSLHISNDEHLLELKNLVSADTSVNLR